MNRIKKLIVLILLLVVLCIFSYVSLLIDERNVILTKFSDTEAGISVHFNSCAEVINPYYNEKEDIYYYFLPSSSFNNVIYADWSHGGFLVDGKKIGFFRGFQWNEGVVYRLSYGGEEKNVRFMKASGIAAIFVSTESGSTEQLDADKEHIESGKMNVIEADGTISYSGGLTLSGRGNSTFKKFSKKPYDLELDDAAGILGMVPDKDFCLLANSWDYSYMNNKLVFDMAEKAGFRFVPKAEYADVWMNGAYRGIYLVTEDIEIDDDRVDISDLEKENENANPGIDITKAVTFDHGSKRGVYLDNLPSDITGGYFLERDYRLGPEYKNRIFPPSYFETEDYHTFINIKSPEYADEKEVDYISARVSEMEGAIVSSDGYSNQGKYYLDYIDLDSWVKCGMIAEIAYDTDKGITNTYIYKNKDMIDGKFYAGPVWDYDCRFGGTTRYSFPDLLTKTGNGWNKYLYEKTEFYEEIEKEWNTFFEEYLRVDAPENIDRWQELIRQSVAMDNVRWDRNAGYPVRWPGADDSENFIDTYVFDDQVNHLKRWIESRREFLDSCWGNS